jgi:hypothetical protein
MEQARLPFVNHREDDPSAFTPESLIETVRTKRGLPSGPIPDVYVLEFDGDLTDALVAHGLATPCTAWACFHTTMFLIEVDGDTFGVIPRTIGGPYAVLVAEQLRASGAKLILGLTSAGRILPDLPVPSIVVAGSPLPRKRLI